MRSLLFIGALILAATVVFIELSVHSPIRPAIGPDGISNAEGFLRVYPDDTQDYLSEQVRAVGRHFLNVRQDGDHYVTFVGRVETEPFVPTRFMIVPLKGLTHEFQAGTAGSPQSFQPGDASVFVSCVANNRRKDLLTAPTADWIERPLFVPTEWCPGQIKLVAEARESAVVVGLGTPFHVTSRYAASVGAFGWLAAVIFCSFIYAAVLYPFIAFAAVDLEIRLAAGITYFAAWGFAAYLMLYFNVPAPATYGLNLCLLALPAAGYAVMADRFPVDANAISTFATSTALLVGVLFVVVVLEGLGNGSWTPNYLFYPVSWSTDNQLPAQMAKYVFHTDLAQPPAMGPWSIVDRGVIPAGFVSGLILLMDSLTIYNGHPATYAFIWMFQVVIQSTVIGFLVIKIQKANASGTSVLLLATLLVTIPFVFFNEIYVWPKLLAGLHGLLGALLMTQAIRSNRPRLAALGVLVFAFGLCIHSSIALFLIGLVPVTLFLFLRQLALKKMSARQAATLSVWAIASTTIAMVLVLFHDSLGVKSSYGATFLLTGTGEFGLSQDQIVARVATFYASNDIATLLNRKWTQLAALVFPVDPFFYGFCKGFSGLDCIRVAQFFSVIPSLGPVPIAAAMWKMGRVLSRGRGNVTLEGPWLPVAWMAVLTFVAILTIAYAPSVTHIFPYVIFFPFLIWSLSGAPLNSRNGIVLATALQSAWFAAFWVGASYWTWIAQIGID